VNRFQNLVKHLLPTRELKIRFEADIKLYLILNYNTADPEGKVIDWQKVVCHTLINLVPFELENVYENND
jgi:hypothetical protein